MTDRARLEAVATAVPSHVISQDDAVREAARHWGGAFADTQRLKAIFQNADIHTRRSCVPFTWYLDSHPFAERNDLYVENAVALLEEAAGRCLDEAGLGAEAIDMLVVASTTGIATPSLDALLVERMAFRRDVQRLPIFGLGCAGGVIGMARAAALAQAMPGAKVLFLVVELCGLTFRKQDRSTANLVATALFGDGAAAALLSTEAAGPALTAWGEHTWPNSLDVMGWRMEDDGFGVLFSREIPQIVRTRMREAVDTFLAGENLTLGDIDELVCHPGGTKVLDALESALDAGNGALDLPRAVLRDYGNMSAATVMFVLEQSLARANGMASPRRLMSSLGPGFTVGFALLEG